MKVSHYRATTEENSNHELLEFHELKEQYFKVLN